MRCLVDGQYGGDPLAGAKTRDVYTECIDSPDDTLEPPEPSETPLDLQYIEGSPPYRCDVCNKIFAIPARLYRHRRVHTGEKPFKCEYCEKTFSVKENLNVHRRIHTKERPYKCTVCDRAFEHSGKLHRHMRTHTGERPHKCEVCGKTFVQSGQLVIHMRAHTGEKPYLCEFCNKGFTCSKQLKVHLRTHTGEKPYVCDICGKTFGYNHVLKMHKMSHLGEKLYKCTICEEFFNSRKALDRHIRNHEKDGDMENKVFSLSTTASNNKNDDSIKSAVCGAKETLLLAEKDNRTYHFKKNALLNPPSPDCPSDDSGRGKSPLNEGFQHFHLHAGKQLPREVMTASPVKELSIHGSNHVPRGLCPPLAPIPDSYGIPYTSTPAWLPSQISGDFQQYLQRELQDRIRMEEDRRQREKYFFCAVQKVLESIIGPDRMGRLGYPQVSIDELLMKTLKVVGNQPCLEPSLASMDRVKVNLRLLLECCVPDQSLWEKFGWNGRSIEDIVFEFLKYC